MAGWLGALRALFERRDVVLLSAGFVARGLAIGLWVLPGAWSLPARAACGLAMGAQSVLYVFGPRMVGGADFD